MSTIVYNAIRKKVKTKRNCIHTSKYAQTRKITQKIPLVRSLFSLTLFFWLSLVKVYTFFFFYPLIPRKIRDEKRESLRRIGSFCHSTVLFSLFGFVLTLASFFSKAQQLVCIIYTLHALFTFTFFL